MAALVVEELARKHRVTVLCGRPSYDPSERHPFYFLRREVRGNLTVERVGSTTYPRFRMRHRVCNYLSYLALAVPRALLLRADVVLAMTDPPIAGIAGAVVAAGKRRPFVYNIRDLYPDMALGGEIVRASRWTDLWERMHRWALRRAARIIVLGDDMRERIITKGAKPERVIIVRDGVPIPDRLPSMDHPVSQEIRGGFPFVLLHAGNLGFYGAWDTLIRAARELEAEGVGLVFVGEGAQRDRIKAAANGNRFVRFQPFRPTEQVAHVLAAGDVHIVTIKRGLEGVVVPSKLYGILAAGRPVLAVAPESSDVARIIRRVGCGAVADPDDAASVVAAVRRLRASPGELALMGQRARAAAQEFERHRHLSRFVEVMESVLRA
jgi:glycosyltransferase involved in cell wall biosynthesis